MARFSAAGVSGALTTTLKSALGVQQPSTNVKGSLYLYQVVISSAATPADNALEWVVQRSSTAGTSTAVTPTDIEDSASTAVAVVGQTFTAEPSVVTNSILLDIGLNMRSVYTLVFGTGYEWSVSPTASRGVTIGAKHASATPTVLATGYWRE